MLTLKVFKKMFDKKVVLTLFTMYDIGLCDAYYV